MANGLAKELIDRLDNQIAKKQDDNDSEWIMLYVLREIYTNVVKHNENPAILLGEFISEHPKLAWLSFLVVWVISGATVIIAVMEFLSVIGVN